ncbi:hypothetical protein ACWOBX_08250 [Facklamia languida]
MLNEIGQNYLIAGIVQQAVKDYKNSLRYMVRKGQMDEDFNLTDESYSYSEPYKIVCECEVFFNSEWFRYLTGTTVGEEIIERVRKEVVG